MKHAAVLILVIMVLACGGADEPAVPVSDGPVVAPPVQSTVSAPDGVPVAYTIRGAGSPALVFIHGWMCNQSFWDAQVAAMSESSTVVSIDLPGHGLSGMDRQSWPLATFGDDVQAVVDHLGLDRVILIGHSMGGPVALEAARLMPDRVIAVVAVDALQQADFKVDPDRAAQLIAMWERDFPGTCTGFVTSLFPESADPALVDRVETEMCAAPPDSSIAQLRQFLSYDMKAAFEAVPIPIPVRCINSSAFPTDIEGNRTSHENFDAIVMDGVGHFLMMEAPEEFNANLTRIIAELSGTRE